MLSIQTVKPDTLELLKAISVQPEVQETRLVGGTSLALQYGHRQSVDFVDYSRYPWIDEPVQGEGFVLASDKDIAAMKVNAIIGRGTRKDFIDLYALLRHYSLPEIMEFYRQKYPEFSEYRALLSMTYFEDAEMQDMPLMFIDTPWEEMKKAIIRAVEAYQR